MLVLASVSLKQALACNWSPFRSTLPARICPASKVAPYELFGHIAASDCYGDSRRVAMRTSAVRVARTLRGSLVIIGAILATTYAIFGSVWSLDPPWRVNEIHGSVVSWGARPMPNVVIRYYKMLLVVKTDDGRNIGVSSERRVPPTPGERILIQERIGLLGSRAFVEIPTP
jgi:hypothetical protein